MVGPEAGEGLTIGRVEPLGDLDGASVAIWTTTPWTIPQNRAVAYNPEISYGLYRVTDAAAENWLKSGETLVVADKLADEVFAAARVAGVERVRDVPANELATLACAHPLRGADETDGAAGEWDFDVPLLPGDHVTDDAGTGFVHTAPSHGDDDYELGRRHGLSMTHNIEVDSSFRADLPFFGGARVLTDDGKPGGANKAVIDKLAEVGALLARKRITISDAHSWRSKAPVIRLNRPQWFAAIDRAVGDGQDDLRRHDPRAGADLDRRAGDLDPGLGPQPSAFDDRRPARLGAVAAAGLGRASDLFREKRRAPGRPGFPSEVGKGQCADPRGVRGGGCGCLVPAGRQGAVSRQRGQSGRL